jgi:hypothetical protein
MPVAETDPDDPPTSTPNEQLPGAREVIAQSLDLALASNGPIRRASLYIGLLAVALVGPAVILLVALARYLGSLDQALALMSFGFGYRELAEPAVVAVLRLSAFCGLVGLLAIAIEAQILVTVILGSVATGRQIGIRDALRLSRLVFWKVIGAAILVGIIRIAVDTVASAFLHPRSMTALESTQIWQLTAESLATAPFAYFLAAIVLGGAGPIESLRRSVRAAAARWRLALLVMAAAAVGSFIQAFALAAGLDAFVRVGTALGLGLDGSVPTTIVTVFVVLAAIAAVGSLVVTVNALILAPQVVGYLRITGDSTGLSRAMPAADGSRWSSPPRLVTLPMICLIVLGGVAAALGAISI